MKLKLIKAFLNDDWYTIERAEHENRRWMEPRQIGDMHFTQCMYSGRICDADVEGQLYEMVAIADAIRNRLNESFKRCSVEFDETNNTYKLCSPRNSEEEAVVTLEEADDLASQIELENEKVTK